MRSWRFGRDEFPVGGIGQREDLWDAYEKAAGRSVDRDSAHWWEVFSNLKWGIMCISQAQVFLATQGKAGGPGAMMELASIGRRSAETEFELLNLIGEPA
jgi:aminoglycoside phosphotransferase (APT) family kinase protein